MICLNNLCERKTQITQVVDSRIDSSNWNLYVSIDSNLVSQQGFVLENSGINVKEQLVDINKLSKRNNNALINIGDYKLSRYICYLIVQNADPSKEVVALGQTYFAIQTRKQEITEQEYDTLSDDEKRFYQRKLTKQGNYTLQKVVSTAGVKNMAEFHNAGYKGLYNGETADDIAKRKKLRYREDILDNMGSEELIANLFRISQTEQKLKRDDVNSESKANKTHYEVGSKIRNTIKELGGTMPEDLPTPDKSLKELEKENKKIKIDDCKYNIK